VRGHRGVLGKDSPVSASQFVCWKDGLPVHSCRGGWRHALGGGTGPIPAHRRHKPVVCPRAEYERAFHPDTPLAVSRAIAAKYSGETAGG
jgi:hypothetical protein